MASRELLLRWPAVLLTPAAALAALLAGGLMAHAPAAGLGLVMALAYVPLVVLNLPLALALWVALVFIEHLPAVSVGPNAAASLIALGWLGVLRNHAGHAARVLNRHRRLAAALASLLVWLTVSMAWAGDPGASADDLWRWCVAALVLAAVATTMRTAAHVRLVAAAFVIGAVISVAVGLVDQALHGSASALESATHTEGRLQGGGGDPNYLAGGLVPAMALAGGLAATTRGPLARLALVASIGLLALGLVESESRGGLLAGLVTLAGAVVIYRGSRGRALLAGAIATSVAAAAFAASPGTWQRVSSFDGGGNGRADLWQVAWRVSRDHPLAGIGLNNFRLESGAYVREPGTLEHVELISERPHVVHNAYLQLLAEEGIVGLSLFLAVALGCLTAACRAARRFDVSRQHGLAALSRAVVLAIGGALVASWFISNATDKRLWALLALGPALLAVATDPVERDDRAS